MDPCYSIIRRPKGFEPKNEFRLKKHIEGDDLDKCVQAIEELLQLLLDGEKLPNNLMMTIINRYQMSRFSHDKRIKKLLYILWECLPKRGPDGKFLDKMVMVCGAFDKDLKHPNQYVCGAALRTLSKTRESEVIIELIHSIEKCLEWSHAYQRKNAALSIARIHKNFPNLNPNAQEIISEYLLKENDDECKRAALQALIEIAPEEAKSFLHSSNDIHCMNASIQLMFVELIQRMKKVGEDNDNYIKILTSLIKSSSSPSVRYQAAATLMKLSRDPEDIKSAALCFISICAKESDNNVKLVALESLIKLRSVVGAERVMRNSIMDILYVLQSATDFEIREKILGLSIDLISPINVGGLVAALQHEMKNILGTQQDTVKYRRLLVDKVHIISKKFPQAIVEMLDTLFELLTSNSSDQKTSSKLIWLLRSLMLNNPVYRGAVIKKIQKGLILAKDNSSTHRGFLQLLGDFSETREEIHETYEVIKESFDLLPVVIKFEIASVLCYALLKMACRYQQVGSKVESDKTIARFMFVLASILNLGHSAMVDNENNPININTDQAEILTLGLTMLQNLIDDNQEEVTKIMGMITEGMRSQLDLIVKNLEPERPASASRKGRFDDDIAISLFSSRDSGIALEQQEDDHSADPDDLSGEIPLTGTLDPIYAYCKFDVEQYKVGLKVYLENRTKSKTLENVTVELVSRTGTASNTVDRPEPIVLAPRATACVTTSVKVLSPEVRRLFGSITFDDGTADGKEQVVTLNDITVNVVDYIKPASISFDDFRDVWRDCEWENKVNVKTKLTSLKEYLNQLVTATNMRCVTANHGLAGKSTFLSANLYARSEFCEEALVNVSIEKSDPNSVVKGTVKIRSRSQGMALSLGDKIAAQNCNQ